jgi:hypothetical protein
MWNMGFYRGERDEGLVIGYLENDVATGRISAMYDHTVTPARSQGGLSLIVESLYNMSFVLHPGASISSGKLIFNIAPEPFHGTRNLCTIDCRPSPGPLESHSQWMVQLVLHA